MLRVIILSNADEKAQPLPEDLIDYISKKTGLSRKTVMLVLKYERKYYFSKLEELYTE